MEAVRVGGDEETKENKDQVIASFKVHYKRDPTASVLESIGGMLIV